MAQHKSKKKSAKRRKYMMRRLMLLGIVLAFILLVVLVILLVSGSNAVLSGVQDAPFAAGAEHYFTGSGFLYKEGDKLCYTDLNEHKNDYTAALPASDAALTGSGSLTAVYSDNALQIIGADFAVEFSGKILDVRCANDYVAVLREDSTGAQALMVYNRAAVQVDQIDFDENTFPTDFGFYQSPNTTLYVTTLRTTASEPITTITTYDMTKGATTGIMSVRRELVESIELSANSIFVVGTNNITRYAHADNHQAWQVLVYGWKLYDYSAGGTKPVFLMVPRNQTTLSTVRIYTVGEADSLANETIATVQLPSGIIDAFLAKGTLYAATADTLFAYNANGKLISETRLPFVISDLETLSDSKVLFHTTEGPRISTIK